MHAIENKQTKTQNLHTPTCTQVQDKLKFSLTTAELHVVAD